MITIDCPHCLAPVTIPPGAVVAKLVMTCPECGEGIDLDPVRATARVMGWGKRIGF